MIASRRPQTFPLDVQSTECQKRVWPIHKVKCKRNQAIITAPPSVTECMRGLRKFTDKHRMKIGELAISALQLHDDASNVERGCLMIVVHSRTAARREHSFYATDADVVRYADMHPSQAADLEVQRRQTDILNKEQGHAGTFFVLLQCADPLACNIAPFGLPMPAELPRREPRWKEQLITILNEGIIF